MALSKIDAANFLTGTIPSTNVANVSLNSVTALPAGTGGKVLQVINATYSTSTVVSSTSFADSGLTANITPSSTSSKILVTVALNGIERRDTLNWLYANVMRNSTQIVADFSGRATYMQKYGYTNSDYHTGAGGASVTYLDSPSTTSETTYKVQIRVENAAYGVGICSMNSTSMITLMEISA
jgi:hypothetical protein